MDKQTYVSKKVAHLNGILDCDRYEYAGCIEKECMFDISSIHTATSLYKEIETELHSHDFYLIIWFKEGSGKHIIDLEKYEISKDTVFFLSPSHLHRFENVENVEGYVISFSRLFLEHFNYNVGYRVRNEIFDTRKPSLCTLGAKEKEFVTEIVNQIFKVFLEDKKEYGHSDYLGSLLTILLIHFQRYGKWNETVRDKDTSIGYRNYLVFVDSVNRNFKKLHKVKEYSEDLNLSVSTLNKSVSKVSGTSPSQIINERIILEAKRMLVLLNAKPIALISTELGFNDVSYFGKYFRTHVGMSPLEYRELSKK